MFSLIFFFFFQAEDGIRDDLVTGVQTCALPIFSSTLIPSAGSGETRGGTDRSAACSCAGSGRATTKIGRASCRERVEISGVAGSLKKKIKKKKQKEERRKDEQVQRDTKVQVETI